ncbi:MAG: DinB family protein [Planctomycetota bacterium]
MNDVEYFQRAFAYDDWANAGHLQGLAKNDSPAPEALRAMAHLLSARAIWLRRITGQPTEGMKFFPALDLAGCNDLHKQVVSDWQTWLAQATPGQLTERVTFHDTHGTPYTLDRATMLTHVMLHSAHHRGQVAMAQRQAGNAPTDLDMYLSPLAQ